MNVRAGDVIIIFLGETHTDGTPAHRCGTVEQ